MDKVTSSIGARGPESAGQEDMNSFANLLRIFLPDHNDLPLTDNTEQLLQQVEQSLNASSTSGSLQCASTSQSSSSQYQGQSEHSVRSKADAQLQGGYENSKLSTDDSLSQQGGNEFKQQRNAGDEQDSDATIDMPISEVTKKFQPVWPSENCVNKDKNPIQGSIQSNDVYPIGLKSFACFICDQTFQSLILYNTHMSLHLSESFFMKCYDCGESFGSRDLFSSHRRLSVYELWVDSAKAQLAMTSDVHVDDEEDSDDDNCDGDDMSNEDTANTSKKKKDEKFICCICGKSLSSYRSFIKHASDHPDVSPFRCAVCQESFQGPCLLRCHIDLQHSHVMPFQCRLCLRRFKMKCSLSTHIRFCKVDPNSMPFAEEMQFIDQLSQQRKYQQLEGDDQGLSQYSCPICTVMFDSPEDLKDHMNTHDETKPYKCETCGRGFRSKQSRDKHYIVHQTKHEYRCEICGVQLVTLSGYNAHLRGHRHQEILQAQLFPDSSADGSGDGTTETASEILQRLKSLGGSRSAERRKAASEQTNSTGRVIGRKQKKYKCPLCGLMFFSGGEKFQVHARKEHKDADFTKCSFCPKVFFGQENLERHEKIHKMYTQTFPCEQCGKKFRRRFALQIHMKMHTFQKFVKCDICGQEFRFVSEVDKHKNRQHRYDRMLNIYKCNICGQRFPMLSHLSVHCYCHNIPDSKPFECDLCKVSFQTSIELKQHIYQKHNELMKKLGDSTYMPESGMFLSFAGNSDCVEGVLVKQEDIDRELREIKERMALNNEMSEMKMHPSSSGGIKTLPIDGISTSYKDIKLEATEGESLEKMQTKEENNAVPSNVDAYNSASLQFTYQAKMLKRYTCEVCDKAFASNSDLKTHRRTHSGETPFKCDFCDRSFKQRGHRKLHIQVVHTKEMPYKCDQCDSAFPTRYRYQVHLKRHMGVREHKCQYCDREFYTYGKLNEHRKKRHPEEVKNDMAKKTQENGDS